MIQVSTNNFGTRRTFNQHNVLYDLSELTDYEEVLFTALVHPTSITTKKKISIISKRSWIWAGNNIIENIYTSYDDAYRANPRRVITIYRMYSPFESPSYTDGRLHLLNAWATIAGIRTKNHKLIPVLQETDIDKEIVYFEVTNKELKDHLKKCGYIELVSNTANKTKEILKNAKYFITDSHSKNYIISKSLNIPTSVVWIDTDFTVLGFESQHNIYINACRTPLCQRPTKFWIQPCPYMKLCEKDYKSNSLWIFQEIEKMIKNL
jgi:hypothetical protein